MPTHKTDLSVLTYNQLSELTGRSYRTIKKRLEGIKPLRESGNSCHFSSQEALATIFAADNRSSSEDVFDLDHEKAKLARVQTEKATLELGRLKGELVSTEEVGVTVEKEYSYVRAKLLSIPSRFAMELSTAMTPNECKEIIQKAISEALEELSADKTFTEINSNDESEIETGDGEKAGPSSTAEAESGRVG